MKHDASSFYVTGGSLRYDAPCYVERQADRDLLSGLREGAFCYVLTSRQMGKSSLMIRTATKLRQSGARVVVLDLTAFGRNLNVDQWYEGLLARLGQQLDLEDELEAFWRSHEHLGPCHRWFTALHEVLLRPGRNHGGAPRRTADSNPDYPLDRETEESLIVFIDEIDMVRSLPFDTDEFFAAIRACYNRRAEEEVYRRLTFCLLGVATPSDLIQDARITPFNIGRQITLNDFSEEEADSLATGLQWGTQERRKSIKKTRGMLSRVMHWTNGHPYLTQRLCEALVKDLDPEKTTTTEATTTMDAFEGPGAKRVDRLCQGLFFNGRASERDDNLVFVRERLLRSGTDVTALLQLYERVQRGRRVEDDETNPLVSVLRLAGVVRLAHGRLKERNRIYHQVFDLVWIKNHMPDADWKRQRAAFWRGVLRTSAVAMVVVMALVLMVFSLVREDAMSSYSEGEVYRTSGKAGQRYKSLEAFLKAKKAYPDQDALRDQVVASLALVDLEPIKRPLEVSGATNEVAFNEGLTHYAWSDPAGNIRVWLLTNHFQVGWIPATGLPVDWISISPNGRYVAARYGGSAQPQLRLWDGDTKAAILVLTNKVEPSACDFARDSSRVAIGFPEGILKVFALPSSDLIFSNRLDEVTGISRVPRCLRLDPSASRLSVSSASSLIVKILSLEDHTSISLVHKNPVVTMSWSPDGNHLATATSTSRSLYFWDLPSETYREVPDAHMDAIVDLLYSPQGNLLASLGVDATLKIWTQATGRSVSTWQEPNVTGRLSFDESGRTLGVASSGVGLDLWRVHGNEEYQVYQVAANVRDSFNSLDFDPEGRVLIAVNSVGIFMWDTVRGITLKSLRLKSSRSLFSDPTRGDLYVSRPEGLFCWPRLEERIGNKRRIVYGPSRCLALPSALGKAAFSDCVTRGAVLHVIKKNQNPEVEDRIGIPDPDQKPKLVTYTHEHIHLFNLEKSSSDSSVVVSNACHELVLSPEGRWLAAWKSDHDGEILIYEIGLKGEASRPVTNFPGSRFFGFSPDGHYFAVYRDGRYDFFETGSWKPAGITIQGASAGTLACPLAFSGVDREGVFMLAVLVGPFTIHLYQWNPGLASRPKYLLTLQNPDRKVIEMLALSRDGRHLGAARSDQTVEVWDLGLIRQRLSAMGMQGDLPAFAQTLPDEIQITMDPKLADSKAASELYRLERLE